MPIKRNIESSNYIVYDLDYLCADGDSVGLTIRSAVSEDTDIQLPGEKEILLEPFTGMGSSFIVLHQMDFTTVVPGMDFTQDWEKDCLTVANALCEKLGLEKHIWTEN